MDNHSRLCGEGEKTLSTVRGDLSTKLSTLQALFKQEKTRKYEENIGLKMDFVTTNHANAVFTHFSVG